MKPQSLFIKSALLHINYFPGEDLNAENVILDLELEM